MAWKRRSTPHTGRDNARRPLHERMSTAKENRGVSVCELIDEVLENFGDTIKDMINARFPDKPMLC